jgi:sec-independent protein translocase protein TatA
MFGMSGEHLLILSAVLLLFGPKQLPALGHSIGRTIKNFKDGIGGKSEEPAQITGDAPASSAEKPSENDKKAA